MRYITQPPPLEQHYPSFISRWYKPTPKVTLKYIISLFKWAEIEYSDALRLCEIQGMLEKKSHIQRLGCFYILSLTDEFRYIVDNMTEEIWASIPNAVRLSMVKTNRFIKRVS